MRINCEMRATANAGFSFVVVVGVLKPHPTCPKMKIKFDQADLTEIKGHALHSTGIFWQGYEAS
jgi:hypothetical protein